MGIMQSLRDLYTHLEDNYYDIIDRISTKIPINRVTDAIDRFVPSFLLLLILIFVICAYILFIFLPTNLLPKEASVNVFVQYQDRFGSKHALEGAKVEFERNGQTITMITNEEGMLSKPYKAHVGDTLLLRISKDGFKPKPLEKSVDVEIENLKIDALLTEIILTESISFRLVDSENNPIASKRVNLSFECSNKKGQPPSAMEAYTDYSGKIQLDDVQIDCLPLLVSATVQGFEPLKNVAVRDGAIVKMDPIAELKPQEQKGRIIVNVTFKGEPVQEAIYVDLYKDTGAAPMFMETKSTSAGQASFEVLAGTYKLMTKATTRFKSTESSFITVGANEYRTVNLEVQEIIVGYIKLQIVDEANNEPIEKVRVTLMKDTTQVAFDETNSQGLLQFNLTKDESYNIVINHESYCIVRLRDVRKSDSVLKIKLKKYTGDCGGAAIVKVVDIQNNPIVGAKVAVFDENGNGLGLKERITDINGEAEFKGLEAGVYKFFAYKGFGSNWSDKYTFMPREAYIEPAVITLDIPKASVTLKVTNKDNVALPFSDVIIKDAVTGKVIKGPLKIEDLNGTITLSNIDSGLPIYFYISNEAYASYTTESMVLAPNEHRTIHVVLEAKLISGDIKVDFLGLFRDGKSAVVLAPGKEYIAMFKLHVPEYANYDKFGIHIRTGKYNIMEKDFIFIKEIRASGEPNIVRSTSFNPDEGPDYDMQFVSAEGAKWANIEWSNYGPGTISVFAKIKVKESAASEELPIFWRAWAIKQGVFVRDPSDASLGDALSPRELYARAYERVYSAGDERLCSEKWCSVLKILDIEENIAEYIDRSYSAKVGKPYKLFFSIVNSSRSETDTFSNVKLKIFNTEKNIEFGNYKIFAETEIDGNASGNSTEYIDVGDIKPGKEIHGEIMFLPKSGTTGSISIRLHDPTRFAHVFEETIFINIIAARQFIVDFKLGDTFQPEPPMLPSGIENKVTVRVRDKQSGMEVSDAIVKLRDKSGNALLQTSTSSLGLAEITVPALMPSEKITLSVEKADYAEARKEISVDGNVLVIEPAEIGITLNVQKKQDDTVVVRLLNKTLMPLKLKNIELVGEFFGLIDERKVQDWLTAEYIGKEIGPQNKLDIALKVPLSDFGKALSEQKALEGKLIASVSAYNHTWNAESKAKIVIGLGGELDNPACLIVSINEWKASTKSNPVRIDFSVKNTCTLDGKPVKLSNLGAKIEWQGNHIGNYYIDISDTSIELSSAYPKIIRGTLNADETLPAMLAFEPDAGIAGTAKATIVLSAEHATDKGKQIVSATINTEINVISIENCIRFNKSLIRIKDNKEESFTIETKGCQVPIDFMLETELAVSEKEFEMKADDSKEIIVLPSMQDLPGQYPIYVKTKSLGESEYAFKKLIRVIIEPEGCLRLNRYEFDIYDDANNPYDGFDTALLINDCPMKKETINISYDERDWWEAIKTGAIWAIVGFVYGGVRAMALGKDFFGNPLPATVCGDAGYRYCGTQTMCKDEKVVVVKNITCCASECITKGTSTNIDLCAKKGYVYCGPGLCEGKESVIEGVTCCSGKCKTEKVETPENICKSAGKYYCKEDERCPDGAYALVGDVTCCAKPCVKAETSKTTPTETPVPTISQPPAETPVGLQTPEQRCHGYYANSHPVKSYEECPAGCDFLVISSTEQGQIETLCCKDDCTATEGTEGTKPSGEETTQPEAGTETEPVTSCVGCYDTLEKCKKAYGSGFTRVCDCELAVFCEYDAACSTETPCYKFKSCNNNFCSLGTSMPAGQSGDSERPVSFKANAQGTRLPTGFLSLESMGNTLKGGLDILNNLLNIDDPWTGALIGFIAGTLFKYWEQSQNVGVLEVPVVVRDLNIGTLQLIIQKGLEEEPETKILVEKGEAKIETLPDKPLGSEKIELVFKNNGITQEEPYKPIYRVLKVDGNRLEYDTNYEIKKKADAEKMRNMEPTVIGGKEYLQKFHLQFNAYKSKPIKPEVRPEVSCKVGGLIGSTGAEAKPKIKLKWSWDDIAINECDESGAGIYCDATQFSIELLKKIKRIDELLRGQSLKCPSAEGVLSEKTQELDSLKLDVAVTRIRVEKSGANATVIGTIKSNNNQEMTVNVALTLQKEGTTINCPEGEKAIKVIGEQEVSCTFTNLAEGLYDAKIAISPQLSTCASACQNENLGNDVLTTKLLVGTSAGLFEKCEPYSTERLAEFAAANPTNANLKEAMKLVSFNAYLIQDGYTLDFRKDFHEFSETKDFFSTPSWYKGDTGLGKYFSSDELFEFKAPFLRPEAGYLPAGKYAVHINITYNNDCWCLFNGTVPNAKIEVRFERLDTPEPDSIFYYMPFDGLVGVDSKNGRQGYGINFRQKSEETILINDDVRQPIRTTTIANSVPIPDGWIEARVVKDFKTLNNDAPGVLLELEKISGGINLIYSPSVATPIILKVSGGERNKAYAFYQLSINNKPQEASTFLASWTGLVKGCKDFSDVDVTEAFSNRRDVRGGVGRLQCAGSFETHQYGIEWCDVKRQGSVFLKTVLFTPQNSPALLELVSAVDDAVFITPQGMGKKVETSGIEGAAITSVEKILKLVEENKVCVAGVGSNTRATFFWNQKEIVDSTLKATIDGIPAQCIKAE